MGLIKDRHGTYCAQQKVPLRLQAAVARVLGNGKPRQAYLKKSLGTKDLKAANVRAKLVLAGFDRTIREASALAPPVPSVGLQRANLNTTETARLAEHVYGVVLAEDERFRFGMRSELERMEAAERRQLGPGENPENPMYPSASLPAYGMTAAQLNHNRANLTEDLSDLRNALALGDISAVEHHVADALEAFGITLAADSPSRPLLGIAVLRSYVRALQDLEKRNNGEPVETPKLAQGALSKQSLGGTLREARLGWERQRPRPARTVHEFTRSVEMFAELHGDLSVVAMKRSHAREFREALQDVPRSRKGALLKAALPELSAWGRAHPEAPKITAATINKQLSAVQAIAVWANENGLVPEDAGWSDPFSKMRLPEDQSDRVPFEIADLQMVFDAPLFRTIKRPLGAKGVAGIWLPLVALFTGARQSEIAGLTVADVQSDAKAGVTYLLLTEQPKVGKRLKTKMSQRAIPVHSQLVAHGLLRYVEDRRRSGGSAWLFPTVAPDQAGAIQAFSKWFGRYLRETIGVSDAAKVFHSFRHNFKDAARAGEVPLDLHDALMGQTNASAVSQGYGAKQMLQRYGAKTLRDAIEKISYPGLDLSRVRTGFDSPST